MVALTEQDARSDRTQDLAPARARAVRVLFAGVGLGSTGYIAAVTVATIVAEDLAGDSAWAGVPGAAAVLGSAAGASILSAVMIRHGRRKGLTAGYLVGTMGAILAIVGVLGRSFPLFLAATALLGFASSSNQLSRYAAADMYPVSRRASAIGTVVWGATIGAVIGPSLGTIAGRWLGCDGSLAARGRVYRARGVRHRGRHAHVPLAAA